MRATIGKFEKLRSKYLKKLKLRARRDDFKLALSGVSSMEGVSKMQKEIKMKTFLASTGESESLGRRDGLGRFDDQHCLRLNRLIILLVDGNTQFRRPRSP